MATQIEKFTDVETYSNYILGQKVREKRKKEKLTLDALSKILSRYVKIGGPILSQLERNKIKSDQTISRYRETLERYLNNNLVSKSNSPTTSKNSSVSNKINATKCVETCNLNDLSSFVENFKMKRKQSRGVTQALLCKVLKVLLNDSKYTQNTISMFEREQYKPPKMNTIRKDLEEIFQIMNTNHPTKIKQIFDNIIKEKRINKDCVTCFSPPYSPGDMEVFSRVINCPQTPCTVTQIEVDFEK